MWHQHKFTLPLPYLGYLWIIYTAMWISPQLLSLLVRTQPEKLHSVAWRTRENKVVPPKKDSYKQPLDGRVCSTNYLTGFTREDLFLFSNFEYSNWQLEFDSNYLLVFYFLNFFFLGCDFEIQHSSCKEMGLHCPEPSLYRGKCKQSNNKNKIVDHDSLLFHQKRLVFVRGPLEPFLTEADSIALPHDN